MAILFISDVHLSPKNPQTTKTFLDFLPVAVKSAEVVYILGDLFDQWLGDDDDTPPHPEVLAALAGVTATGVPVHVMRGNHDFLLGKRFQTLTGCRPLADPSIVELYGSRALVTHGDLLCTDDASYQRLRKVVRNPLVQWLFQALPLHVRATRATSLRQRAHRSVQLKAEDIMDVAPRAVEQLMLQHRARYLIHGHTHRPAIHDLMVDGAPAKRIVLGDWYDRANVLVWDRHGYRMRSVTDAL